MARRCLRLLLASALFWTGTRLCPMSQTDCEGHPGARSKAPCHGQTGDRAHCCKGVHLTEAGAPSVQALAAVPRTSHPAGLPDVGPELAPASSGVQLLEAAAPGPPLRPPPRESLGRSPPAA